MDAEARASSSLIPAAPAHATSFDETPVFFRAGDVDLLGVLTRPTGNPLGVSLIAAAGGLRGTSMGRNRMFVRLSRQAAARGFHAFRFDYHGVGESSGTLETFSLDAPFGRDLEAAARCVESEGIERHVLAGICFGARTVLSVAPTRAGVVGAALVEPVIRSTSREGRTLARYSTGRLLRAALKPWVIAGLFKREQRAYYAKFIRAKLRAATSKAEQREATDLSWVSNLFLDALERLIERRIPVLLIYGEGSESYREFGRAKGGRLGELLRSAGPLVEVRAVRGEIHGFSDLVSQQRVIDGIVQWAFGLFNPQRVDARQGDEGDA